MLSINQTIDQLFDLQKFAIKLGLDNIRALAERLDNPQHSYPVIHVAGTNGKGSSSFFIAAILNASGLKTGLFTSPHLADFRERIMVNGEKINEDFIRLFWQEQKEFILKKKATFFDTTAALAFTYFREQKVDVAIIETGLGGRLDSTNLVDAEIVVLTPISFDHEKQLGQTLPEIAAEKAGIIKNGSAVFSAPQAADVLNVFKKRLKPGQTFVYQPQILDTRVEETSLDHTLFSLTDQIRNLSYEHVFSRMAGFFQVQNQSLAYAVSRYFLEDHRRELKEENFRNALKSQIWPGRLQLISRQPDIVFDVSHNPAGVKATLDFLKELHKPILTLVGLVEDKNQQKIAALLSEYCETIVITEPETPRRLPAETLGAAFNALKKETLIVKDSRAAFELVKSIARPKQIVLVIGSHYLIGNLMKIRK